MFWLAVGPPRSRRRSIPCLTGFCGLLLQAAADPLGHDNYMLLAHVSSITRAAVGGAPAGGVLEWAWAPHGQQRRSGSRQGVGRRARGEGAKPWPWTLLLV